MFLHDKLKLSTKDNDRLKHNIEHALTQIFCFVDDLLKQHPGFLQWRNSNNDAPNFSDAEVLTIAVMQPVLEVATLKQAFRLVADNAAGCFPRLPSYKQWLARLHRLQPHLAALLARTCGFFAHNGGDEPAVFLIDSFPVPVCLPVRHGTVRLLRDESAAWGKSSKGWFFGFKLHALTHAASGKVVNLIFTPANVEDRAAAHYLTENLPPESIVVGDLGYRGEQFQREVGAENHVLVLTRDCAPKQQKHLLGAVRQAIERTFSEWWRKFTSRVFSRSWLGLWNTVQIKVLYYNLVHSDVL